jgi:hypothetical protein
MSPYRSTPDRTLQDMAERGIGLPELRQAGQTLAQAYVPDKGRAAIAGAEVPGTEIPEA